jgi:hypothetical protein
MKSGNGEASSLPTMLGMKSADDDAGEFLVLPNILQTCAWCFFKKRESLGSTLSAF